MSLRTRALVPAATYLGALLLAGGLAACSPESIIEKAIEDQTGVKVDEDGGEVTFTDEDGNTTEFSEEDDGWVTITDEDGSVYTQGEGLPEDFPSEVPLIDLPVTFGISSLEADGSSVHMLTIESDTSCDGLYEDGVAELTGSGFVEENSTVMDSSDGYWAFGTFIGAYTVTYSVGDDGEGCAVSYTVESIQKG